MKLKIIFGIVILLLTSGCTNSFNTCMDNCMAHDDKASEKSNCDPIENSIGDCFDKWDEAKKYCYEVCSGK